MNNRNNNSQSSSPDAAAALGTQNELESLSYQFGLIFYDGDCAVCNRSVQLLLRRDKYEHLRYCALESDRAAEIRQRANNLSADSVILYRKGSISVESDAVIDICVLLGGWYRVAQLLRIIPRALRNALYRFVAKHRHVFNSQSTHCIIPTVNQRALFLD